MQKLSILILLAASHQALAVHAAVKPSLLGPFGRLGRQRDNAKSNDATAEVTTASFYHDCESSDSILGGTRSKVGELIPTFEELVASTSSSGGQQQSDLHVGKLLTAMKQMENHMRGVGMKQGADDLAQNIDKVQQLYIRAPADMRDSMTDLLKWEIETGGIAGSGPITPGNKLPNKSAAMGLSWLGHNIRYQYNLYKQMLDDGGCDPVQAATSAFQQHIGPHLPRTVSMIAQRTIPKLMPRTQSEFFSTLGGLSSNASDDSCCTQEVAAVRRDVNQMLGTWEPLLEEWTSVFDSLSLGAV